MSSSSTSSCDVRLDKPASSREKVIQATVNGRMKLLDRGIIIAHTDKKVVSTNLTGNNHPSIRDRDVGAIQLTPTFVMLIAWYDNDSDWGYVVLQARLQPPCVRRGPF